MEKCDGSVMKQNQNETYDYPTDDESIQRIKKSLIFLREMMPLLTNNNIAHNDLHLGNVLYKKKENSDDDEIASAHSNGANSNSNSSSLSLSRLQYSKNRDDSHSTLDTIGIDSTNSSRRPSYAPSGYTPRYLSSIKITNIWHKIDMLEENNLNNKNFVNELIILYCELIEQYKIDSSSSGGANHTPNKNHVMNSKTSSPNSNEKQVGSEKAKTL